VNKFFRSTAVVSTTRLCPQLIVILNCLITKLTFLEAVSEYIVYELIRETLASVIVLQLWFHLIAFTLQ